MALFAARKAIPSIEIIDYWAGLVTVQENMEAAEVASLLNQKSVDIDVILAILTIADLVTT